MSYHVNQPWNCAFRTLNNSARDRERGRSVRRGIKETSYIRQLQPSLDRDDQYSIDVVDPFLRRNLVNLIRNTLTTMTSLVVEGKNAKRKRELRTLGKKENCFSSGKSYFAFVFIRVVR